MKGGVTMWALNKSWGFLMGCVGVGALLIVIVGVQSAGSLFHTGAVVGGQAVHITFKELPTFFSEVKGDSPAPSGTASKTPSSTKTKGQ